MVSLKNGILKVEYENSERAKRFFDICFVLNIVTIFALYAVKLVATVTGIMTLVAAVFIWVDRREKKVVIPYNSVWYLIFTLYCGLTSFWSEYVPTSNIIMVGKMVVIIAMITAIAIYVDTPEDLERLMSLFIFSVVIIILLELTSRPLTGIFDGGFGSGFSYFNSNEIAFWIMCAEMMAFYKAYIKNKKACYILVVFFVIFVIATSSRKATVSAVVSPLIMVLMTTRKKYKFLQVIGLIIAIGAVAYLIMTNDQLYNAVGRRFNSMMNYYSDDTVKTDSSIAMRNYYIEIAKELFGESPLFGKGMANFIRIIGDAYNVKGAYCHNNYWQVLSELGITGFVLYYSFYFFIIVKLAKDIIKNKSRIAIIFLAFMIVEMILEWGIVSFNTKTSQIVVALAYTATYVGESDGRKYRYIKNNINKLEEEI